MREAPGACMERARRQKTLTGLHFRNQRKHRRNHGQVTQRDRLLWGFSGKLSGQCQLGQSVVLSQPMRQSPC